MADELATLPDLQARLDWTLSTAEESVATSALADLSDDARFYGSSLWDSVTAPRQFTSLVLRAAARYMRNPDGFTESRAGDETVEWADREEAGTAAFNKREQKMLAAIAGKGGGITSVSTVAYGPTRTSGPRYINPVTKDIDYDTGYVPSEGAPLPWYAGPEGTF
jgi:hypothetical protein